MASPWEEEWKVVRKLAVGGQGVTKLVESKETPRVEGALKYLKNNKDNQSRARIRREVASLESLHALGGAVPRVLDHNTENFRDSKTELYVVTEYIPGKTLKEFVESNDAIDVDQAIQMTLSLCETVSLAHRESILHRDIKPENIIVRNDDFQDLVIIDYGLSFNEAHEVGTRHDETIRNKFLDLPETNTPGGDRRDPRSDVTSLCAIFYYILTKHTPGHLHDAEGRMPHLRPGYSLRDMVFDESRLPQIEMFLSRGLTYVLQNRFQAIDELTSRLENLLGKGGNEESNPVATAKELSEQLRTLDRKTQLAEFSGPVRQLMTKFTSTSERKYKNKLDRFGFALGGPAGPALPSEFDGIVGGGCQFTLSIALYDEKRTRSYKVASRGEQCFIFACNHRTNNVNNKIKHSQLSEWEEIAWYEGDGKSILPILESDLTNWLEKSMNELANNILAIT